MWNSRFFQFYNAKITNAGESTFVVLFTEYGNAEEVRKTDCLPLPIISACPTPPHNAANFIAAPHMNAYSYHSQQNMPYKNAPPKNQRRN